MIERTLTSVPDEGRQSLSILPIGVGVDIVGSPCEPTPHANPALVDTGGVKDATPPRGSGSGVWR